MLRFCPPHRWRPPRFCRARVADGRACSACVLVLPGCSAHRSRTCRSRSARCWVYSPARPLPSASRRRSTRTSSGGPQQRVFSFRQRSQGLGWGSTRAAGTSFVPACSWLACRREAIAGQPAAVLGVRVLPGGGLVSPRSAGRFHRTTLDFRGPSDTRAQCAPAPFDNRHTWLVRPCCISPPFGSFIRVFRSALRPRCCKSRSPRAEERGTGVTGGARPPKSALVGRCFGVFDSHESTDGRISPTGSAAARFRCGHSPRHDRPASGVLAGIDATRHPRGSSHNHGGDHDCYVNRPSSSLFVLQRAIGNELRLYKMIRQSSKRRLRFRWRPTRKTPPDYSRSMSEH